VRQFPVGGFENAVDHLASARLMAGHPIDLF